MEVDSLTFGKAICVKSDSTLGYGSARYFKMRLYPGPESENVNMFEIKRIYHVVKKTTQTILTRMSFPRNYQSTNLY